MRDRGWLTVSGTLMLVYVSYIVWAKFSTAVGTMPVRLSETSEFLLFLAAIVAFVLQVFVEDAKSGDRSGESADVDA